MVLKAVVYSLSISYIIHTWGLIHNTSFSLSLLMGPISKAFQPSAMGATTLIITTLNTMTLSMKG